MKLLIVSSLYPPYRVGGAEAVAEMMAQGMKQRGYSVSVLTLCPGDREEIGEVDGIRVVRLPVANLYWNLDADKKPSWQKGLWHALDMYNGLMARKVRQRVADLAPDVVCVHNLPGFSVAIYDAVRQAGVPLVQILHDCYFLCPYSICYRNDKPCASPCRRCRLVRTPHQRTTRQASAVVGVSRFTLDKVTRQGLFAGVRQSVVHNVCPREAIPEAGTPSAARTFGYIGTLAAHKGLELLIDAFAEASQSTPIQLVIAGSGEPAYVERLQRRASVCDAIRFLGRQPPAAFFPLIDALVVPSLCEEALSLAAQESCLAGRPVIASHRGGIPEIIHDRDNGLLFDPVHPSQLVESLQRLASDDVLFNALCQGARASAQRFGDVEGWLARYEAIFRQAIADFHSSSPGAEPQ